MWALPAAAAAEGYELLHKPGLSGEGGAELVVGRVSLERWGGSGSEAAAAAAAAEAGATPGSSSKEKRSKKSKKGEGAEEEAGAQQQGTGATAPGGGGGGLGTFARTGHSLRMMERVAVALAQNEPVLLVGGDEVFLLLALHRGMHNCSPSNPGKRFYHLFN